MVMSSLPIKILISIRWIQNTSFNHLHNFCMTWWKRPHFSIRCLTLNHLKNYIFGVELTIKLGTQRLNKFGLHAWWLYSSHAIQNVVQDLDWSPLEGLLVWRVNEEGKTMLLDGKPKPCKPILMKNVDDIIKGILNFMQDFDCLRVVDVSGSFCHQFGTSIGYWTHVHFALMDLHQDSPLLWGMVFCHKVMWMFVGSWEARLLENGEVHEEFNEDDQCIGLASVLWWIITKVVCSFCVMKLRHMLNKCGWLELCPRGGHSLLCYVTTCVQRVFLWGLFTSSFGFKGTLQKKNNFTKYSTPYR